MNRRSAFAVMFCLISMPLLLKPAHAEENKLEMGVVRIPDQDRSGFRFGIFFGASKAGALTCELTTPDGTFDLSLLGDMYRGDTNPEFVSYYGQMSVSDAQTAVSVPWTLVWDKSLAGETTVEITFTPFEESEFPPVPTITFPQEDAVIENPDPNPFPVTWFYEVGNPCDYGPETAKPTICLISPVGEGYCDDELDCNALSYLPPEPFVFTSGIWSIRLSTYVNTCFGEAGINVLSGEWAVATHSWGALISFAKDIAPSFDFTLVPIVEGTWGSLKNTYR